MDVIPSVRIEVEHQIRFLKDDIQYVRRNSRGAAQTWDRQDDYSSHYCAYMLGKPVAALRITRASLGTIECEDIYPRRLLEKYRASLANSGRFCALPSLENSRRIGISVLRAAWREGIAQGCRLDVTNCHVRGLIYYQRLGYWPLRNGTFWHPYLGTPSHIIAITVDGRDKSVFQDLFLEAPSPLTRDQVEKRLLITPRKEMSVGEVMKLKKDFKGIVLRNHVS